MIEAVLTLVLLLATLALAITSLRLDRGVRAARGLLFRSQVMQSEAMRLQRAERQLAEAQNLSETVVAGGAQTVRAIHMGIAAIPFGILEAIPLTRDTTRLVRATHDLIAGAVYSGIGAVNRGVGVGLRAGLNAGLPAQHDREAPEKARKPGSGPGQAPRR